MKIAVRNTCDEFKSYRAARVKSLFNASDSHNFSLDAQLPIDDPDWKLGLIVGPSGSGKTSIGRQIFGGPEHIYDPDDWPLDGPIVDAIKPGTEGALDSITAAFSAVGLGDVHAWLRPFHVLSNGEQFRANLARLVCERPERVVVDEFTSVVDRQIAKIGAMAFGKTWKRGTGQAVLLSCHYDIIEWLEPDWVFDTATGKYSGRGLWRRPRFELQIWQTDWRYWDEFEPYHYLKVPRMIAAKNYVGTVNGERVCHLAVSTRPGLREARACRLVVMPEWQGAGIGIKFLEAVCDFWLHGENPFRRDMPVLFHTSHPGLCAALRARNSWAQVSAKLMGNHKGRSGQSIAASGYMGSGYCGHFRAVQGFRYWGDRIVGAKA